MKILNFKLPFKISWFHYKVDRIYKRRQQVIEEFSVAKEHINKAFRIADKWHFAETGTLTQEFESLHKTLQKHEKLAVDRFTQRLRELRDYDLRQSGEENVTRIEKIRPKPQS